jgi:hypothetical protein
MKIFTFLLLISFSSTIYSQEESNQNNFYLDANFGLLPVEGDLMNGFNLSAGHRFSDRFALGLALNRYGKITVSTSKAVLGVSLEPRLTFNRVHLKFNGGLVMNGKFDDEFCKGRLNKHPNFFFRPGIEYRIGAVTFGASMMFAPNLVLSYTELDQQEPSGFCNTAEDFPLSNYESRFGFISVGLSFPKLARK